MKWIRNLLSVVVLLYLGFLAVVYGLYNTKFQPTPSQFNLITMAGLALSLICLVCYRYHWSAIFLYGFLASLGLLYLYLHNKYPWLMMANIGLLTSCIQKDTRFGTAFLVRICVLAFVITWTFNHQNPIKVFEIPKTGSGGGIITAYSLGFVHPNNFGSQTGCIVMLYLAWRSKNLKWWDLLLVLLVTFTAYQICKTRTLLIILIGLTILAALCILPYIGKWISWLVCLISVFAFPVAGFFSVAAPMFYTRFHLSIPLLDTLNNAFSNRIYLASRLFDMMDPTLLGDNVYGDVMLEHRMTIDNAYVRVFYAYGWIGLVLLLTLFMSAAFAAMLNRHFGLCLAIIGSALWCMMEPIVMTFNGNAALFVLGILFDRGIPAFSIKDLWPKRKKRDGDEPKEAVAAA